MQNLFEGKPVTGKPKYQGEVITKFKKTILILQYASSLNELKRLNVLNFEGLRGDMKGFYSVRVDKKYRLILRIEREMMVTITEVLIAEDLTNHYD